MTDTLFQKGRFYTLPIVEIRDEDSYSYFIVEANGREYAIRMFEFQRQDPEVVQLKELPCMVKDIHGENIVFVQNFAEMFGNQYDPTELYQFIVVRQASTLPDGQKYYDVHDERGVPFRLKTRGNIFLQPNQKINCRVVKPSPNKLQLVFEGERKQIKGDCVSPSRLLHEAGLELIPLRIIENLFNTRKIFAEARKYLERNDAEWVIKALLAVPGVEEWGKLRLANRKRLLEALYRLCLYVLEDSTFLMQFSESERENFQEWIAEKVQNIETYRECLDLLEMNREGEEIDNILRKIHNAGYIYKPHHKMTLLIAIFSMKPEILEERIEMILDIIAKSAKDWKVPSFKKAFSRFLQFYILTNRDAINREAFIEDDHTTERLNRMVRAICYLLLMTEEEYIDVPLYKSMLYHYLSFVRCRNVLGQQQLGIALSDSLVERAFQVLFSSDASTREISWDKNFGQTELFAFQISQLHAPDMMLTTRSYESDTVRFTVSNEGITLSRTRSTGNERNVLPKDFLNWHNIQIYLDNPTRFPISPQSKISSWSAWWKKVETALFEKRETTVLKPKRKISPEVGTEVTVRVLRQDPEHTNRFYCRIEDDIYQGEGKIETYIRGGMAGMFHYDPQFDTDCFYLDGKPLLFRAKVNAVNVIHERNVYSFDAVSLIDKFILENVECFDESDCRLIFHDERNRVMLGITEYGYGLFVPDHTPDMEYKVGDCVRVRLTSYPRVQTMQGEVIGAAETPVNVRVAARQLLLDYSDNMVYEESAAELAEAAMAVSEDQFNVEYISQMICILDHKAVVESNNSQAYGYLSVAFILAGMIGDKGAMRYLDQRRNLLYILEQYGSNGTIDEEQLKLLSLNNADLVEKFPVLKQRLSEIRIVNSLGKQENNTYLWELAQNYDPSHIVGKLARLMLSYNMADGFALQDQQNMIISKIKDLLGINIELPQIYSFGEEGQTVEFKSSIVFPPNNGMQPNLQEQTFNIMKVICGMVNAYGGTLYLGVYDTGTAKGLDDDILFFENSRDKFDLYVRNQIRQSLGDAVNAATAIEYPEAGKHWVYAIKVRPSRTPVMLGYDKRYYLREGSSTYAIDDVEQLREIMDSRDFEQFKAEAPLEEDSGLQALSEVLSPEPPKNPRVKGKMKEERTIATSLIRRNITNNWVEGYGDDTFAYLRIHAWGDWCLLKDVEWEDGLLTLAIHNDETDGYLIAVYEDGEVQKVPLSPILKITPEVHHKMAVGKHPVFVCPAREGDAILTAYHDEKGKRYLRLDDISRIPTLHSEEKIVFKSNEGKNQFVIGDGRVASKISDGKFSYKGVLMTDSDFKTLYACDIIPQDHIPNLRRLHNLKRNVIGFPVANTYSPELSILVDELHLRI